MFVVSEMRQLARTPASSLGAPLPISLRDHLNRKLANKVVLNVGLCIALFDITKIGHSYIFPGDGASYTEVNFRFIVFRPFIEEILIGKIRSSSRDGVHVTLGFFDDILIPVSGLQHPSRFDETDQVWVWEYPVDNGDKHDFFMDAGETIRFRITSECFQETSPAEPPGSNITTAGTEDGPNNSKTPYRLLASINEPGLGLLTWWENRTNEAQEEDEDAEEEGDEG